MTNFVIEPYEDKRLGEIVSFWNREFADRVNFFPVTEDLFRKSVIERETDSEIFYPDDLLLGTKDGELIALCHIGWRTETLAKAYYPDWKSGGQGFLAFLYVTAKERRKGYAKQLYEHAISTLPGTNVVIDGQCYNPFYGNLEYPHTPFFGTPEGISIPLDDKETEGFFKSQSHDKRFDAITLELQMPASLPENTKSNRETTTDDMDHVQYAQQARATMGIQIPDLTPRKNCDSQFGSFVTQDRGLVTGYIIWYRMKEVAEDLGAIYEMMVEKSYQGKGIGSALMQSFLEKMKDEGINQIQVLTIPKLSPDASGFYQRFGFQPKHHWAIY